MNGMHIMCIASTFNVLWFYARVRSESGRKGSGVGVGVGVFVTSDAN